MARLTNQDVQTLVNQCSYKDGWSINLHGDFEKGEAYIQISVSKEVGRCSISRKPVAWKSGKRSLSKFMCRQEIVGCVFALIKDAEMHEIHEFFRYKGASIYNPHLDPDVLAMVASNKSSFVCRENAMSMEEKV